MASTTGTPVIHPKSSTSPQAERSLPRELNIRDLTLFGIVCIVGPRWIPAAAHAGPGSVTLWLLASLLFGIPLAIAVAALMAKYPEPGGLYAWAVPRPRATSGSLRSIPRPARPPCSNSGPQRL